MECKNILEDGRACEMQRPRGSGEVSGSWDSCDTPGVNVLGAKWSL